jgi:hypothetical protein
MCSEHQLTGLMTRRPVSGMRSRLFQRTCSTEHGKSSNIVRTFSVLPREPTSRSTEVNKKLPEFHYDLPQTIYGSLNLLAHYNFSKTQRDFVDTLYTLKCLRLFAYVALTIPPETLHADYPSDTCEVYFTSFFHTLMVGQVVRKFRAFYAVTSFIIIFTVVATGPYP